jgi:hypothetical protein
MLNLHENFSSQFLLLYRLKKKFVWLLMSHQVFLFSLFSAVVMGLFVGFLSMITVNGDPKVWATSASITMALVFGGLYMSTTTTKKGTILSSSAPSIPRSRLFDEPDITRLLQISRPK